MRAKAVGAEYRNSRQRLCRPKNPKSPARVILSSNSRSWVFSWALWWYLVSKSFAFWSQAKFTPAASCTAVVVCPFWVVWLGSVPKSKRLDVYINRMEKRPDGSTDAQIIELIATTIQSRVPQAENILISGDLSVEQLTSLTASLQHTSALGNKNLTAAESILSCAKTVSQATTADVIVLVADCEKHHLCKHPGTMRAIQQPEQKDPGLRCLRMIRTE